MRRALHEGHRARLLQDKGDQKIVSTVPASSAREAVGENAALQIAAKLALHVPRHALAIGVPCAGECQVGLEMPLYRVVQGRALGAAPAVDTAAGGWCLDREVHATVASGW
jgi:hypothetical protein